MIYKSINGGAIIFLVASLVLSFSCKTPDSNEFNQSGNENPQNGQWDFTVYADTFNLHIPVRAVIDSSTITFINGVEEISTSIIHTSDSAYIPMPVFGTYFLIDSMNNKSLSGRWVNPFKQDYQMPFSAAHSSNRHEQLSDSIDSTVYEVRFSPDTDSEYPAVGIFINHGEKITGTFLTETGDYRFLQGAQDSTGIWLSTFDGAHLFYLTANYIRSDSLSGMFYSGKHYSEPWQAIINPKTKLSHPDSITYLTSQPHNWQFQAYDLNHNEVVFSPKTLNNKVTLIQILGTWCPNCMDETVFFKDLRKRFKEEDLQIIPVAYERGSDTSNWVSAITKYKQSLGLDYPIYYGGPANKGRATEQFSFLTPITSFPTTLFIDKQGKIRKVHTGFYGPGTGLYYDRYTVETTKFINNLISEDYSTDPS